MPIACQVLFGVTTKGMNTHRESKRNTTMRWTNEETGGGPRLGTTGARGGAPHVYDQCGETGKGGPPGDPLPGWHVVHRQAAQAGHVAQGGPLMPRVVTAAV